jgi:hypothetical protein
MKGIEQLLLGTFIGEVGGGGGVRGGGRSTGGRGGGT